MELFSNKSFQGDLFVLLSDRVAFNQIKKIKYSLYLLNTLLGVK